MEDDLRITTSVGDILEIQLDPNRTPTAYERKKRELISCGMTPEEADEALCQPFPMEVLYSIDNGLFLVETEPLDCAKIYNPYTGKEIPNDNL